MIGIVLMSYGSPTSIHTVDDFISEILNGRSVPEERLEVYRKQYRSLETVDQLGTVTARQAEALQQILAQNCAKEVRVYPAFKHAAPTIEDTVKRLIAEKATHIVAVPMNPLYSKSGAGSYIKAIKEAIQSEQVDIPLIEVTHWHLHPKFVNVIAKRVEDGVLWVKKEDKEQPTVVFTAHSQRGAAENHQEYIKQFNELAKQVANMLQLEHWEVAFRGAGPNKNMWVGPFLHDVIDKEAEKGQKAIVICDLLSLTENAEVVQHLGLQLQSYVHSKGMEFIRTEFLNDSADFMFAMAEIIKEKIN